MRSLWTLAALGMACSSASGPGADAALGDPVVPGDTAADTGAADAPPVEIDSWSTAVREGCAVCVDASVSLTDSAAVTVWIGPEDGTLTPWVRSEAAREHRIPILQLRSETTYAVALQVGDAAPPTGAPDGVFATGTLPSGFPPLQTTVSAGPSSEPGITLVTIIATRTDATEHFLAALDGEGHVIWYEQLAGGGLGLKLDGDGRILSTEGTARAIRIDPLAGTKTVWLAEDLGVDTIHHEVRPTDGGGFTAFASEHVVSPGWWETDDGESLTFNIISDIIASFDETGQMTWSWSLLDHVDPLAHHTEAMHWPFWNMPPYDHLDAPKDWSHGNALLPTETGWLASFRNLDWLIQLDAGTGDIDYIFGPYGDFALAPGGLWFSRQHAPHVLENGNILLYDNGNNRTGTLLSPQGYSRVVEYSLDFDTMTATEEWAWTGGGEQFLSPVVGDVDPLPNGHHLITDGAIIETENNALGIPVNHFSARVREVAGLPDNPAVVWEVIVGTPGDIDAENWIVFRSLRLPSLYPVHARPQ